MICFELQLNGRPLTTAGIPGFAVLTSSVTWVQRKPRHSSALDAKELTLHLGGLDSNSEEADGVHLHSNGKGSGAQSTTSKSTGDRELLLIVESPNLRR